MSANNLELSNLRQRQRVLQMLMFSMVTLMIWIGFSLFRSQRATSTTSEQKLLAEPLTPSINQTVINDIEKKRQYSETELSNFPIYKLVTSKDGRNQTIVPIGTKESEIDSFFSNPISAPIASPSSLESLGTETTNTANSVLMGTEGSTASSNLAQ